MRSTAILLSICLVLVSSVSGRVITFEDLYNIPRCRDPQISPDGRTVLFVLHENDLDSNSRFSSIWIMNQDGTGQHRLTGDRDDARHPRWTDDGTGLLFLSKYEGGVQVWRMPINGGPAVVVTSLPFGVSGFENYSERLLIASKAYPDCHTDSCNLARRASEEANQLEVRQFDSLLFRHYGGWRDPTVRRLYQAGMEPGSHIEICSAYPADAPTTYLGGYRDFDYNSGNETVCFSICTSTNPAIGVNNDLCVSGPNDHMPTPLTSDPGLETSPRFSPDGRWLAYHQQARAGYESDQRDLVLLALSDSSRVNLTGEFDLSVGYYEWSSDARRIYFMAIEAGFNKLWRVELATGEIELLLGDACYTSLAVSPNEDYLIVGRSLSNQPYELYRFDLTSRELDRLTRFTEEVVADLDMRQAEEFWFEGFDGDQVHGLLTLPPDFDSTASYSLTLLIHGGPQWCWLGDFNYYGWNTQLLAAQGYVVVQIDPHGSVGYGLKFKEYVSGNWGRGDYDDLMIGIDYVLANHSYIDSTRLAALGRSYGGFMVNWICGHTDRFVALIGIDGTFDQISEYGTTDELWFPEWELGGTPWTNRDEYVRASPGTYAANFKTPMLVIHGQKDYRVDVSEGFQMFTTLQRLGVPSQMLYFPDEGHSIRKLANLRFSYEKQLAWLARWIE